MDGEPDPPNLDEPDAMDDYWFESTTITVDRWAKWELDQRRDDEPWTPFLAKLGQQKDDPVTLSEADAIAEAIMDGIDTPSGIDSSEIAKEVSSAVVDDLSAQLPRKIAEELQ